MKKAKTKENTQQATTLKLDWDTDIKAIDIHSLIGKTNQTFQLIIELNNRVKSLISITESFQKKIDEIHKLHFSGTHIQDDDHLINKYLAEILIGKPRKRNRGGN